MTYEWIDNIQSQTIEIHGGKKKDHANVKRKQNHRMCTLKVNTPNDKNRRRSNTSGYSYFL